MRRSPNRERGSKLGAENEVAGGGIDGFRWNVNGSAGCSICQITFYEFEVAICPHYVRFSVNSARCPEPEPRALIRQSLGYTRRQLPTILAIARHKQRDSSASPGCTNCTALA